MRVLHLPVNYGSLPSHTVRLLRQAGVDAHGLMVSANRIQSFDGLQVIYVLSRSPIRRFLGQARWAAQFIKTVIALKPDLIHWYYGKDALPLGLDLALVKALRIPRLVEWQGSDIRIPEVEFAENPYYTAAYHDGYEYKHVESLTSSRRRQARFAAAGFASTAPVGMFQYIQKDLFPHTYVMPQRLILADFEPAYPDPTKQVPLIVHSPTSPAAKGTPAVLKAIETIKAKHDIEFQLLHGLPRDEVMALMRRADIVLDQFVLGDRGMSALEGMALGKPVLCYIKPSLSAQYPADSPIVNTSPDALADTLESLITGGGRREQLGRAGRAYVEKYYAQERLVSEIMAIYQDVIENFPHTA